MDHRLDELVSLATQAGERTNRAELAAAIVCSASTNPARLGEALRNYRTAQAKDVVVKVRKSDKSVGLRVHRPGPRKRSG